MVSLIFRFGRCWTAEGKPAPVALDLLDLDPDPLTQFQRWYADWCKVCPSDPEAMFLATSSPEGQPSVRTVLMRGLDERGFGFFTNYEGRKGRQLSQNPLASLLFYWPEPGRQVRVEGSVVPMAEAESDAYYASRPRLSQLGAWASHQSRPLESRHQLLERLHELEQRYPEVVPRPPHWGGFRLRPASWEFWQAGEFRLHDSFRYDRRESGWSILRLNP
ncbi:pyridoxamine 5'-phosphate oxidase [bacterium CPR1]|nr:pyridoxamine 5'-phosphate oxidase [bacterium CPR1]